MKWYIIRVKKEGNNIVFYKVNKEYIYNDIEDILI